MGVKTLKKIVRAIAEKYDFKLRKFLQLNGTSGGDHFNPLKEIKRQVKSELPAILRFLSYTHTHSFIKSLFQSQKYSTVPGNRKATSSQHFLRLAAREPEYT